MKHLNSVLKNKLRNYSILAGSALAASTAHGQIIYHNLDPDVVLIGEKYHLDLNGNGEPDFTFQEFQAGFNEAEVAPSYATPGNSYNAIGGTVKGASKIAYPNVYNSGQKIGSKVNWFNLFDIVNSHSQFVEPPMGYVKGTFKAGRWNGVTGKFLALKVVVRSASHTDSLTYYGWTRCNVSSDAAILTISDYAYQSISDSAINAGDTGGVAAGISAQPLQNVTIFSSGKNVVVKYPGAHDRMTILIRDMLGKEVRAVQTTSEMYELNLAEAAAGVYMVTVRSKNAELTKKVQIQ